MDSPITTGFYIKKKYYIVSAQLRKECQDQEKRKQTLLRRKTKEAKTFELKLDRSKISKTKLAILNRLFLEAKWSTNYIIANGILQTACGLQGKNGSYQGR